MHFYKYDQIFHTEYVKKHKNLRHHLGKKRMGIQKNIFFQHILPFYIKKQFILIRRNRASSFIKKPPAAMQREENMKSREEM